MTAPKPDQSNGQISFRHELVRKATHMGALVMPGSYYWLQLDRATILAIMIPATILMIVIDISRLRQWSFWRNFASPIASPIVRGHELAGDFTGATYILITFCLTIALFDKPIAIAAMAFIIVGDSFAAIIGRRWGKHKWFHNKSIEGSLGCLAGCLIVAVLTPGIALPVVVFGAVVASLVEAMPWGIDDNVTVPIISGLLMTLAQKITITF